ncbi:MAG TPA: FG-GAP-like repeat-containing protein [Pyrinomonadaceae bacterium]|jgi:hypothetical protein
MPSKTFKNRVRPFFASAVAVVAALTASPALAQVCDAPVFRPAPVYAVGSETRGNVAADFDGDGRADLAVTDVNSNSVTVLTKVARDAPAESNTYAVGNFPVAAAAGDFNGDGKVDLAVGNNSSFNVSILLNDGAGRLLSNGAFAAGVQVNSIKVADFNSDGRADITAAGSNSVSVMFGDGHGGFAAPVNVATGQQPTHVLAADLNADGKPDIAFSTLSGIRVLLGNGAGAFTAQPNTCAQTNTSPFGLAAGDVNGDGKTDLVMASVLGGNVAVLTGNGSGCFAATGSLSGGSRYVELADLNADGKLDIIQGTSRRLGDGAGGFGAAVTYGTGSVGQEPGGNTVVADFDADGKIDIATAGSGTAGILFGDGAGGFRLAVGPRGPGASGLARGDFNGDGKPDLVTLTFGNVTIMPGDGAGGFGPPANFLWDGSTFRGPVVADFNRDGKPDVAGLGSSGNYLVLPGNGAGALGAPIISTLGSSSDIRVLEGGDFNGDGNPDLLTLQSQSGPNAVGSVQVLLGDGAGHFSVLLKTSVGTTFNPKKVGIADFNADGKLDLAVPGGSGFSVLRGDGAGGFGQVVQYATAGATAIAVSDFNGDGRADLALVSEEASGRLSVVLGDGQGGFGPASHFAVGYFPRDVTTADFNGDGRADIAVANVRQSSQFTAPAVVSVLLGDGAGGFSPAAHFNTDRTPDRLVAGDLNGDGRADIATANETVNNLSVLLNTCGAASDPTPVFQFGASLYTVGEGAGSLLVTVVRTGSTAGAASVRYATVDGTASSRSDYIAALGTLRFADGEGAKTFRVLVIDDAKAGENNESLSLSLSDPVGAVIGGSSSAAVSILENDSSVTNVNPIDSSQFFVREHYLDFLNREPDASGLAFWTNEIESCGADAACREVRRINVSAAFFLSIEFQETGYLSYRMYKVAYGDATSPGVPGTVPVVRLSDFLADTQEIGQGVVVGPGDEWKARLEANKQAYALGFVQRPRFLSAYPLSMTAAQFIDKLDQGAGGVLSQAQRDELVAQLSSAPDQTAARAAALRQVAEHAELKRRELNRAFVLMQYFGYLRRNPDDAPEPGLNYAGWKFWLDKLDEFGGNYVAAEMVRAFITSDEYRQRFGQ